MRRFVVTASLRRGTVPRIAAILREGQPFDLAGTSLERSSAGSDRTSSTGWRSAPPPTRGTPTAGTPPERQT